MIKKYIYLGSQRTSITLPSEPGEPIVEAELIPYQEVELPDDLEYTQRLVYKGLLQEVPPVAEIKKEGTK